MNGLPNYNYAVTWSEEDGEYVATCAEFPLLSFLLPDPVQALAGLMDAIDTVRQAFLEDGTPLPEPLTLKPPYNR